MIELNWVLLGWGAVAGALAGIVFFIGLAWGMRLALKSAQPTVWLLASSTLRIAGLLGLGWLVAGFGSAALAGFALAFLLVRTVVLAFTRAGLKAEAVSWS